MEGAKEPARVRRVVTRASWPLLLSVGILAVVLPGAWAGLRTWTAARADRSEAAVRAAMTGRRLPEARAALQRWLDSGARAAAAHYWEARLLLAEGRPQECLDALQRALRLGHPRDQVEQVQGVVLALADRLAEAEPLLMRTMDSAPEPYPELAEALARLFIQTFRFGAAGGVLDRWAEMAPADPKLHRWRAEVLSRTTEDPDVLSAAYRLALEHDPAYDQGRLALAELLRAQHRNDEAQAHYQTLLARDPQNVRALVGAGRNALELGDPGDAARHFEEALRIDPNDPVALRELGTLDLQRGRLGAAIERLEKATGLDRLDPAAVYALSLAYARAGRSEDARRAREDCDRLNADMRVLGELKQELVRHPTDIDLQVRAARWLLEHGKLDEGLAWARRALQLRPGHPDACRLLADHYRQAGQNGLANYYHLLAGPPAGDAG